MSNPYVTVQGPNYGAGLMNWQGMLNPQQGQANKPPGQQQPGQPGQPGQPQGGPPGQPGSQAQQQMQGLGQRLRQMFMPGGGQPGGPGQMGGPMPIGQQGFGGQQPITPTTPGPTGLY